MERNKLLEILNRYFQIGVDCTVYDCTRDRSAFSIGTMTLDDFQEWDEERTADLADWLVAESDKEREGERFEIYSDWVQKYDLSYKELYNIAVLGHGKRRGMGFFGGCFSYRHLFKKAGMDAWWNYKIIYASYGRFDRDGWWQIIQHKKRPARTYRVFINDWMS